MIATPRKAIFPMAKTSTDVTTAKTADVELPEARRNYLRRLQLAATISSDSGAILEQIRQRVEVAETVDDVLSAISDGPTKVEDILNTPLEFIDWRPILSADQYKTPDGENVYVVMAVVNLLTGEELIVQGGGRSIVMALEKISRMDNGFPFRAAFWSKQTSSGYDLHLLRPLNSTEKAAVAR